MFEATLENGEDAGNALVCDVCSKKVVLGPKEDDDYDTLKRHGFELVSVGLPECEKLPPFDPEQERMCDAKAYMCRYFDLCPKCYAKLNRLLKIGMYF